MYCRGKWTSEADSPKCYSSIAAEQVPARLRLPGLPAREVRGTSDIQRDLYKSYPHNLGTTLPVVVRAYPQQQLQEWRNSYGLIM